MKLFYAVIAAMALCSDLAAGFCYLPGCGCGGEKWAKQCFQGWTVHCVQGTDRMDRSWKYKKIQYCGNSPSGLHCQAGNCKYG
ncbi:hypothetical protein CLAFUW4_12739 [Fulvia fulva]|uniref:Uncharacterized protein n=1 Tax=Passalora fulva TaxID=5499 RepID=A0A9Q8PJT5_PASFU|nr:uncharacterized protein CLAFUR5_12605 [Fulvia fulva]KAK4611730.1 hypothetical protein CLAFUR4_12743 [Fulvia fulva]KAK4612374.1 hypothetical protein CLAFUR0_12750 [Fulvia fulva]UJO23720.1 hypothetical protein CLAFUR5_12605 [Fulvia fulva]WPV21168.1 hypothetical protein CLAFUW4_12739 [Fulvia fulva]WPV36174.1 hypothetical protein CLAFUW7_12746 [Fulvia fulva]